MDFSISRYVGAQVLIINIHHFSQNFLKWNLFRIKKVIKKVDTDVCFVFGRGIKDFPNKDELPTEADVLKHFFYVKFKVTKLEIDARKIVSERVMQHFNRIDPTSEKLSLSRINVKIKNLWEKRKNLRKNKKESHIVALRNKCSSTIFEIRKQKPIPKTMSIKIVDVKNFKPLGYVERDHI